MAEAGSGVEGAERPQVGPSGSDRLKREGLERLSGADDLDS